METINETIIAPAGRLGEIEEYYFSRKLREIAEMRADGHEVLNLGIGSPDLPPSQATIDTLAIQSQTPDNHGYQSYAGLPELRSAMGQWYQDWFGVSLQAQTEVLPLIGSKEGIMHISMTYLEAGDEVLVPNPGYPAYRAVAQLTGARIREYLLDEANAWLPDLDALEAEDLSRVKIMWLNYPNMPTGAKANKAFFARLIDFARRKQILICNDNPYAFILNDQPESLLSIPGAMDVALELNSLSKAHNMAGWRVGMLVGKAAYLQNILRFKSNMDSGMYKPVQLAAIQALQNPPSWYEQLNKEYHLRRVKVFELMDRLDCRYDTNQVGLFIWARIPNRYRNGYELADEVLYKTHVFITPGGIFGSQGDNYIRISLCSPVAQFELALKRLEDLSENK
ncbi:MAG: aminotransferase [Saprospiraceae bacterium]|nr:MAG: aminotransferase [Saprospiraceae bacterium]